MIDMLRNSFGVFSLSIALTICVSSVHCTKADGGAMQSFITDGIGKMPVQYTSNLPFVGNQTVINKHVHDILMPLMPLIRDKRLAPPTPDTIFNAIKLTITDADSVPSADPLSDLHLDPHANLHSDTYSYPYPGPQSPPQSDSPSAPHPDLLGPGNKAAKVLNALNQLIHLFEYKYDIVTSAKIGPFTFSCDQTSGDLNILHRISQQEFRQRSLSKLFEFQYHPLPGLWWFVKCISFETGASGLDITGIQKPGGDSGIDPNALKSLVG